MTKGSCFLFRPGDRVWAMHNPNNRIILSYIHFDVSDVSIQLPKAYRLLRDTMMLETCLNLYQYALNERSTRCEDEAKLLLMLMLQQLRRNDRDMDDGTVRGRADKFSKVYRVADYIRQHPETRHCIGDLAERSGLSPRYFSSKFKEVMKVSVETFIIQTRIQKAENLLRHDMTVAEVADALGYKSQYFFSRQFKKYRGKTPSDIKRSI